MTPEEVCERLGAAGHAPQPATALLPELWDLEVVAEAVGMNVSTLKAKATKGSVSVYRVTKARQMSAVQIADLVNGLAEAARTPRTPSASRRPRDRATARTVARMARQRALTA